MNTATSKRLLILCRKPPYGNALAREALDIALAASVFEQDLAIAFIGDGVWQLHKDQNSTVINSKSQQKLLSALPLYDIKEIYVDAEALEQRNIATAEMFIEAEPLVPKALALLLNDADIILNF